MRDGASAEVAFEESASREMARVIYVLYLFGLAAGITAVIGLAMAYLYRVDASEWLQTHYRYQIRTFWIATTYLAAMALLAIAFDSFAILLLWLVWGVSRVVRGLVILERGEAHPHVGGWL
jgi:uncharacterized membrane protein